MYIESGLRALKTRPSDFELLSITREIEAVLNCRPISKQNSSVEDWQALTPMSLRKGNLHPASPVTEFMKWDTYRSNYKYVVSVSEQFYFRWLTMYLPWLQISHRWRETQGNVCIGDLVLLLESLTEGRRNYLKGLIVETFPNRHNNVRSIKSKVADWRVFTRDVRSIVHLL